MGLDFASEPQPITVRIINEEEAVQRINECRKGKELLDLSGYQGPSRIYDLLSEISHLKMLHLVGNNLKELPKSIYAFERLEQLFLDFNNFSLIPTEIANLSNLRQLSFGNNPEPEENFYFYFQNFEPSLNSIEKIPAEIAALKTLEFLDLSYNQIKTLPKELIKLYNLSRLYLNGNPIDNIPNEFFEKLSRRETEKPIKALFNYLESIEEAAEVDYLHEAKLVMVGRGAVGKTSLARKLITPKESIEKGYLSTEGIDISTWDLEVPLKKGNKFRFNIWDFGGQQKYDTTHQFFITERSLYLFVTEARKESNFLDFDYWLNIIQLLGKEAPVIVVQNKIDEREKQLPSERFQKQYSNILRFVNVSCADGWESTIETLIQYIKDGISRLPQVGDQLPKPWVDIRKRIEVERGEKNYLSYEEYVTLCKEYGLNEEKADFLSQYFHDLGIIVHYRKDFILKKTVIINPDWAVDGVYKVLDTKSVERARGRFMRSHFEEIWNEPEYKNMHAELLALMKNYGLCFELGNSGQYIIPELLPVNTIQYLPLEADRILRFNYKYTFMPSGIMVRLIVKLNEWIEEERFWRHGVILKYYGGTRAEVLEDIITKEIKISVVGKHRKILLGIIRSHLKTIHDGFRKLEFSEMIPCNCEECLSGENTFFFDHKRLRNYLKHGRSKITCDYSFQDIDINQLLNDVIDEEEEMREPEKRTQVSVLPTPKKKKKVFFSYSRRDIRQRNKLNKHLSLIQRQEMIDAWYDQMIRPGERWEDEIMDQLHSADIVLLLISSEFLASDYCYKEMNIALEREKKGQAQVIPIVLRHCNWEDSPFSHLNVLPVGGFPVTDSKWKNQDEAYSNVVKEIKRLLVDQKV